MSTPRRSLTPPDVDPEIQAGSRGLSIGQVASRYLRTPGSLLAILRQRSGKAISVVAASTGISESLLKSYEEGASTPSLQHLSTLSRHYGANLKPLLDVYGHLSAGGQERESLGIAAQFSEELTEEEKQDLRGLVESYSRLR